MKTDQIIHTPFLKAGLNRRLCFRFTLAVLSIALPIEAQRSMPVSSLLRQAANADRSGDHPVGPTFLSSEIASSAILLRFSHAEEGLLLQTGVPSAFQIAGADHKWFPADAHIVNGIVVVSTSLVQNPVAVRYAWPSAPNGDLFNGAGRSAAPFRTDDWAE